MKNIFCIFRLHPQNLPTVASSECMTKKETTKKAWFRKKTFM